MKCGGAGSHLKPQWGDTATLDFTTKTTSTEYSEKNLCSCLQPEEQLSPTCTQKLSGGEEMLNQEPKKRNSSPKHLSALAHVTRAKSEL